MTTPATTTTVATTAPAPQRFKLWLAITGAMAPAIIQTIKPPHTVVPIVYERSIPIPRLWHDKKDGVWKPEQWGGSLFDPSQGWNLDLVRAWCRSKAAEHATAGGGPLILDIEDVHPFLATMKDSKANLAQLLRDLSGRPGLTLARERDDIIAFALRQLWTTLLDELHTLGVDASVYGHTPDTDRVEPSVLRAGRCWFDARQRRTHPVIYEWKPDRDADTHRREVALQRISAARRACPLAPCMPFIWPFIDDGSNKPVSPAHFTWMVRASREAGCAGVVLWHHAKDTPALKTWLGILGTHILPALEGVVTA